MADEPLKDGFCFQVEKGLWIRLDRAPAVRLVGQIVDAFLRVVLRPSDCLEPFSAIRIGTDKSALEPVAVVGVLRWLVDVRRFQHALNVLPEEERDR